MGMDSEAAEDAGMEIPLQSPWQRVCRGDSDQKNNPAQEGGLKASIWSSEQVREPFFPYPLGNFFFFHF